MGLGSTPPLHLYPQTLAKAIICSAFLTSCAAQDGRCGAGVTDQCTIEQNEIGGDENSLMHLIPRTKSSRTQGQVNNTVAWLKKGNSAKCYQAREDLKQALFDFLIQPPDELSVAKPPEAITHADVENLVYEGVVSHTIKDSPGIAYLYGSDQGQFPVWWSGFWYCFALDRFAPPCEAGSQQQTQELYDAVPKGGFLDPQTRIGKHWTPSKLDALSTECHGLDDMEKFFSAHSFLFTYVSLKNAKQVFLVVGRKKTIEGGCDPTDQWDLCFEHTHFFTEEFLEILKQGMQGKIRIITTQHNNCKSLAKALAVEGNLSVTAFEAQACSMGDSF